MYTTEAKFQTRHTPDYYVGQYGASVVFTGSHEDIYGVERPVYQAGHVVDESRRRLEARLQQWKRQGVIDPDEVETERITGLEQAAKYTDLTELHKRRETRHKAVDARETLESMGRDLGDQTKLVAGEAKIWNEGGRPSDRWAFKLYGEMVAAYVYESEPDMWRHQKDHPELVRQLRGIMTPYCRLHLLPPLVFDPQAILGLPEVPTPNQPA